MKKDRFFTVLALIFLVPAALFAQQNTGSTQKFALVIGNGAYTNLSRLANPVNDAEDVAATLEGLGFTVDKLLNATLEEMVDAVIRLRNRLSVTSDSYGFFFYAGHGVQSGGENYLIPVNAIIPTESFLRNRALSVQEMLDEINNARNELNIIVLDACRDNPFGWARSGSRGLEMVSRQPADSIIVYATSAGQVASDGTGRNGLFTAELLNNLGDPNLEVNEVFRRTMGDVVRASGNVQRPAVYSQFPGLAWLGGRPELPASQPAPAQAASLPIVPLPQPAPEAALPREVRPVPAPNNNREAHLWTVGASVGSSFAAPLFVGTVHLTLAPFRNSFLKIGLDAGYFSGNEYLDYSSIHPFAHYAFFLPFGNNSGWFIGAGGGYLWSVISNVEWDLNVPVNTFSVDIGTGLYLGGGIYFSYTFRSDFTNFGNKLALGYAYRFN
jgi:hypothetical protein